ncbi:MAG: hypothetical protein J6Z27_01310, partial [Bacteroidales bacterium]|nr:hypothetical protein [Bacteroidales bacterium]
MKRIVLLTALFMLSCSVANAQGFLRTLGERAKNAAENAIGNKVENAVTTGVEKAADILTGKNKSESTGKSETAAQSTSVEMGGGTDSPVTTNQPQVTTPSKQGAAINWNNYDFVAGDEII